MTFAVITVAVACASAFPFLHRGLHEWRIARTRALAGRLRSGVVEAAAAHGTLDGVPVRIMVRSPKYGGLATIARAGGAVRGVSLSLRPRRREDAGVRAADEVATGDAAFDRAYRIVGTPAEEVRALFDDDLRARVRAVGLAWAKLGGEGARVERPGFARPDREDVEGDLDVARLAAALSARAATRRVAPGDGAAYREDPAAAPAAPADPPATPDLHPEQIWLDENLGHHKLVVSVAFGASVAAVAMIAWWAGVWT